MCGRFSLGVDTDTLVAAFGISAVAAEHRPRYNIAPGQPVPAVVRGADGLRLGALEWGLAAGPAGGARRPLINARAETVDRRPAFAEAFRRRRCWILADGFYEWRRGPDGRRTPFHIRLPDGRPFAFAGIWGRAGAGDGPPGCVILTTAPAPAVRPVHDRMPVILTDDARETWLDPAAPAGELARLLCAYSGDLEVRPVSSRVNAVQHDDPACLHPPETSTR